MSDIDDLNERWKYLIEKYISNTCSKDELEELLRMVESEPNKDGLGNVLRLYWQQLSQGNDEHQSEMDIRVSVLMQQA